MTKVPYSPYRRVTTKLRRLAGPCFDANACLCRACTTKVPLRALDSRSRISCAVLKARKALVRSEESRRRSFQLPLPDQLESERVCQSGLATENRGLMIRLLRFVGHVGVSAHWIYGKSWFSRPSLEDARSDRARTDRFGVRNGPGRALFLHRLRADRPTVQALRFAILDRVLRLQQSGDRRANYGQGGSVARLGGERDSALTGGIPAP